MKRCPQCNRVHDDELKFCPKDGTPLLDGSGAVGEDAGTVRFGSAPATGDTETRILPTGEGLSRQIAATTVLEARAASGNMRELGGPKSRRALIAMAAAIAAIALTASAYVYLSRGADDAAKKSIAVLPFQNASGNPDVEYLSDGISESLINSLSRLPNVRVLARSTMFSFKGKDSNPQEVGRQLGVETVLTGRVVQRGEALTVQADLVNVSDGSQVWGERYNRRLTDVLAVQDEIVRDVSRNLRVRLSGADESSRAGSYTENAEAYQLYLRGRFHWNKRTAEGFSQAADYFRKAIERDPNYALAYAGLADCYVLRPGKQSEELPKARDAAERALALDPTLAEAHTSLAFAKTLYGHDWAGARAGFEEAIRLNPKYPTAHQWFGIYWSIVGRPDEALAEINRAIELDPLSLIINTDKGRILFYARRYDEAIRQLQETLKLDADFGTAHFILGWCYAEKGMYDQAVAEIQRSVELGAVRSGGLGRMAYVHARAGRRDEAQKILVELEQLSKESYVSPYAFAVIYSALGEHDRAFSMLHKSVDENGGGQSFISVDPAFDPLRSDPRFAELVRRVGLPQ